jgi:PAS domain S-box-containing protein
MQLSLKLKQQGVVLVLVPLLSELVFVAVLVNAQQRVEDAVRREAASKALVAAVERTHMGIYDVAEAFVNFAVKKNKATEDAYLERIKTFPEEISSIQPLIPANDAVQQKNYEDFAAEANDAVKFMDSIRGRIDNDETIAGKVEVLRYHKAIQARVRKLVDSTDQITEEERKREQEFPLQQADKRNQVRNIVAAGVALQILITILLALFFTRRIASRVATIINNAYKLARGEELSPPISGKDEIEQLDRVFHSVAATLREASRRERAIVDNVQAAICTVDSKLSFTKISSAAVALWGYDESELLGLRLSTILYEEDRAELLQIMEQAKQSQSVVNHEARITRKDQTQVWMMWSIFWSAKEDSYFCVAQDVNERKILEQLKADFVNMVSHDLRTPLTAFRAFLQTLEVGGYGDVSDKGKAAAGRLQNSVERLVVLINDLLDMEKMEAGRMELSLQPVKLSAVVQGALDMVASYAEQQHIILKVSERQDIDVEADGDRLIQVVQNLVANAIKFSGPNKTVEVSYGFSPERSGTDVAASVAESQAEIAIIDQGSGISAEDQKYVFDRFHQLKNSQGKVGSGLGLAICKTIIDAHNGIIGVSSQVGEGSTFWFRLPIGSKQAVTEPASSVKLS